MAEEERESLLQSSIDLTDYSVEMALVDKVLNGQEDVCLDWTDESEMLNKRIKLCVTGENGRVEF